ncbi:MAG: VTT domain-containing protein [Bryobacteraceae bacterium]|nr:VTT domain-containing protein [Bryobacteraceae bacterium]
MDEILQLIQRHGPALLFGFCFLEAAGVPIPAALALLAGGAAAAQHVADLRVLALAGLLGLLLGDVILYVVGRFTGWWLLGILCRLSANPESCILSSADRFYRQGRITLLLAKFVPGLSALAAPLAGSMRMPAHEFLVLDGLGAALYAGVYLALGYLAGDAVKQFLPVVAAAGRVIEVVAALGLVAFLAWRYWQSHFGAMGSRALQQVPKADVSDVAAHSDAAVFDVRSHGYYEPDAQRIKGAVRLEPNRMATTLTELPEGKPVFLYCTCYREATSLRVAQHLRQLGHHPVVIEGGLERWQKAGLPVEPVPAEDIILLPNFGRK